MKKLILTILFCIVTLQLFAMKHQGKPLYMFGDSAEAVGRAGTGVSSTGVDLFYLNPASMATIELFSMGLNYGTLPVQTAYHNPNVSFGIPTSYGVIGASVRYFNFSESADFSTGYGITLGGAKELTQHLSIGLALNIFSGSGDGTQYFIGGSFGFIYRFDGMNRRRGFGFFDPRIGTAVQFGLPLGDNRTNANFNAVTTGYRFTFLQFTDFSLTLFNDVTAYNYKYFPVKIGLETRLFDRFTIRGGYTVMNQYDYGDITVGAGVDFSLGSFDGTLNYSVSHYQKMKFVHYVGLKFQYGPIDRTPPKTTIRPTSRYISPNFDGKKDYIYFNLDVDDASRIKGWRFQVIDDSDNLVAEYKLTEHDQAKNLTLGDIFMRIFQKKESMVVPEKIMWDGFDHKRKVVPDGRYHYSFNAWDARDNIAALKKGVIHVDNTAPTVELKSKNRLFSPNGDNRKDEFIITQKYETAINDEWIAGFKNDDGKIIKAYKWTGYNVAKKVIWDGKDQFGRDVPEGLYTYFIYSADKAGNTALGQMDQISLTRKYEVADITISQQYFSYRIDKMVSLFPKLDRTRGLHSWKIAVYEEGEIDDTESIKEIRGTEFSKLQYWDCKDSDGDRLGDGKYYIKYSAEFTSGNNPGSFKKMLIIDSTPPDCDIDTSPGLFSPDNDGEADILNIHPDVDDNVGIKNWKITIFEPIGAVFKMFEGKGQLPNEIKWDGYGDNGEIVESAADYTIQVEAMDLANNFGISDKEEISVDVLVLVTERGLKMRISNIEFGFGKSKIKRKGRRILNRVSQILGRYEKYNVVIEGHTDDVGKEEYNLELSEKRAKAVMNYITDRGIDEERLSFMGMGETTPLFPNNHKENRRRNRRVEFLLIKMKDTE